MGAEKIKVLIADDHSIFLDGLKFCIESDPELEVVGMVVNGQELIEAAMALVPDVIVTDIMMPGINGIDAIRRIHEFKEIPCIALSTFDTENLIQDTLDAGATGYMVKNAGKEIIKGIKAVYNGSNYFCKEIELKIFQAVSRMRPSRTGPDALFSKRDIEIIKMIAQEIPSGEMGKRLYLSKRTVDGIRSELLSKTNVKSSAGLILYALRKDLITLDDTGLADATD